MQTIPRITFHNLAPSEAVETRILQKIAWLERVTRVVLTGCDVAVEARHHRHHQGNLFHVRIGMTLPGSEIVVSRQPDADHSHEDVYVAIRDAFDAARRRLEDRVNVRRGKVKRHRSRPHGIVVQLLPHDRCGFVRLAGDTREVYFHANAVPHDGFSRLRVGSRVGVVIAEEDVTRGPHASLVVPLRRVRAPAAVHP